MQTPRRILVVSDTVVQALYRQFDGQRFGEIDLVLSCGDLPPEYLTFLTSVLKAPLCYVRGNHDIRYDTKPPDGCLEIHGRIHSFGSLRVLGLGGSRWYNGGPNQYTEQEMRRLIRRLRPSLRWKRSVDIVLTHAPPRYIHDAEDPCHRGFRCLRRLIDMYQPAYLLHGHIHAPFDSEDQRITRVGRTRVINCFGCYLLEIEKDGMVEES
ncbi:MAG: metallophosphoesterase [Deltaproteobacteria bacterium]|nr:metallophosphoesterase [Deltaproteobacteria bacterium]